VQRCGAFTFLFTVAGLLPMRRATSYRKTAHARKEVRQCGPLHASYTLNDADLRCPARARPRPTRVLACVLASVASLLCSGQACVRPRPPPAVR
jgi:hypothetical protein